MSIFDEMASTLAQILGSTSAQAGMLLGSFLIFGFITIIVLIMREDTNVVGIGVMAAVGMSVAITVGWWDPVWAVLVVIVLAVIGIFGRGSGSGSSL